MKLLLLVLAFLQVCVAISDIKTPHLRNGVKASCVPVDSLNSKAYVEVELRSDSKETIPTLIIPFTLLLQIDLPIMPAYNKGSVELYVDGDKFILNLKNDHFDDTKVTNKPLGGDTKSLKHSVNKSGYYCVYVAPTTEDYDVAILYKNSYGYLPVIEHISYSQKLWGIPIMLITTVLLFRNLIQSVGKNFKNLNNISVVAKSAVFFLLFPAILVEVFTEVVFFILNHTRERGTLSVLAVKICDLLSGAYSIATLICILYFCMGYGVIYYHRQTRSFRQLPESKSKYAKILAHVCAVSFVILTLTNGLNSTMLGSTVVDEGGSSLQFISSCSLVVFLMVVVTAYILSIVQYFKTKKTMKEFPPYASNIEDYAEKNDGILKAFKRSMYLIFVLPIYAGVIGGFVSGFSSQSKFIAKNGLDLAQDNLEIIPYLFSNYLIADDQSLFYYAIWNEFVIGLVVVVGVYFIWVKNNEGLVIDQNEDHQFDGLAESA